MQHVGWFVCGLLLAGSAMAQERRATAGTVLDAAGKPVANASVWCTTPLAPHATVQAPEVTTVRTDAEGRFRAELRIGHAYAMGAAGTAAGDGAVAVSALAFGRGAGEFVTLRLAPPRPEHQLHVAGLAAWGELAPRRVRLLLRRAPGLQAEVALDANGAATLPPLPDDALTFDFLTAANEVLVSIPAPAAVSDAGAGLDVALPAPAALRLVVRDGNDQPVAGATVLQRVVWEPSRGAIDSCLREAWRTLGATDASGELDARTASAGEWLQVFVAKKPGMTSAVAARHGDGTPLDARHDPNADRSRLQFVLGPERPLTGSLWHTDRDPAAGCGVFVEVACALPVPQGGTVDVPLLWSTRTDAAGAWCVSDVPADFARPRLLSGDGCVLPGGRSPPPILAEAAGRVAALERVVLARLPSVDLQVVRADGDPAEGAVVLVVPTARRRWFVETWDARHRVDRSGRARFATVPDQALLFVTDGVGFAWQRLGEDGGKVSLQLQPLATSRWTVTTPDGRPAAGARLRLASYSPPIQEGDPLRQALGAVAVSLHAAWLDGLGADEHGVAVLRTIPDSGTIVELGLEHTSGQLAGVRFTPGDRALRLTNR